MAVRAASWAFLGLIFTTAAFGRGPGNSRIGCRRAIRSRSRPMPGSAATNRRPGLSWTISRKIDLRAFTLADPYRVVIDIPQVTFLLPPKTGESGRGLIKAFRFGLVMQGGSRLVFDLAKPVRVEKAFVGRCRRRRAGAIGA